MNEQEMYNLEKPHPNLLKLYFIRTILSGPFFLISFPYFYFRYHTLRYKFDQEGISMRWGILFRREVHLNYSRIQDIHLTSGILQRWLNLADIQIQTASGSASAEMIIEGLLQFEDIRTFIYSKMRGFKDKNTIAPSPAETTQESPSLAGNNESMEILSGILDELKKARMAIEEATNSGETEK